MDSIRRDISDDDNALIRALFVSKHNAVVAVLTSVGYYMHKHHSDFFDASNWKEILVNCFDTESSAPNTSSRFSLNASSIPASQELCPARNHPTKALKNSQKNDIVLATTPEPSFLQPASKVGIPDDDDDISFDIPETQAAFTQKQPEDVQDEDSNDSYVQVQPAEFNTWVPETQSLMLDSRSNSPTLKEADNEIVSKLNAPILDDGDETDCEEEMSALNWNEKSANPVEEDNRVVDCGSVTPDLLFEAVLSGDDKATKPISPSHKSLIGGEDLDDEIPISQLVFEGDRKLDAEDKEDVDEHYEAETQLNELSKTLLPRRNKRKSSFEDAPTQKFPQQNNILDEPNNIFDQETQPFCFENISKTTSFYDAPTQVFKAKKPRNSNDINDETQAIDFDAPTQLFVRPKPQSDHDDIFNKPTQKFRSDVQPKSTVLNACDDLNPPTSIGIDLSPAKDETIDDIFMAPTQQMIPPKRQSIGDDIYFAPTQCLLSSTTVQEPSIYDLATQAYSADVTPQISHNYTSSTSTFSLTPPNTTSENSTTCSPSNKENNQHVNQSVNLKKSVPAKPNNTNTICTPNAAQTKLKQTSSDFDTPQYDFLKFADPIKIRQIDEEMSSKKKAKMRFLFQDSSDESDSSDSEAMSKVVSNLSKITHSKSNVSTVNVSNSKIENIKDISVATNATKSSEPAAEGPSVFLVPQSRGRPRRVGRPKSQNEMTHALPVSTDSDSSPIVQKRLRGRNVTVNKTKKVTTATTTSKSSERLSPVVKLVRLSPQASLYCFMVDPAPVAKAVGSPSSVAAVSSKRQATIEKPKILFTIVDPKPHSETIEMIGGTTVDSASTCTVLVTNKVYRTCKFLSAMGRGTPIVSEEWISECAKQRRYINPNNFILQDGLSEKRYKFNLVQSLEASRHKPIFANISFFVTPNTKPLPHELHSIITCAAGHSILNLNTGAPRRGDTVIAVSCKEDRDIWPKVQKRHPGILIISTEGLMLSVMQHRINFKPYKLK